MAENMRKETATGRDGATVPAPGAWRAGGRLRARLRRLPRWWPLPLCALLGAAAGASYGLLEPPRYTATSYVVVVPAKGSDPAGTLGLAQAYGRVATGGEVLADAHQAFGVPIAALRGGVRAMTSPDAPMIEVTGTAHDPRTSAKLANAVARSLTRTANDTAARTGAALLVLSRASAPTDPVSPSVPLSIGVGGCAGGLLGGLLLLVRRRKRQQAEPSAGRAGVVPAPAPAAAASGAVPAAGEAVR
ncbi:lipopolysaccharide biosynthesis protein [Streptomyces inhibens]|uniref:lipopolysaccharide biosynthesis protein n=1 Tax=Streptomyces inhibens TaxID=2293571 RepID=UPI001EE7648F|nr:lipopolysaccharide biosynthesis protein [Streptomyces inhibens]UKY50411.1 lipopolysaccharide biosynthesis protein [Streptomyces inhibens]